ncbi:hypothetical protein EMCRGX_G005916 [Ephydatia muelleri]
MILNHPFTLLLHPATGWSTAVSSDASGSLSKLLSDDKSCYCIVQHLDPLMVGTTPQLNHFDCPLFTPTNILRVLPSVIILVSVSVIHKCNPTCILKEKTAETRLEQQSVTQKTVFVLHDWSNTLYCYNFEQWFMKAITVHNVRYKGQVCSRLMKLI